MDTEKIIDLVYEKTRIPIDKTDPVFALVALNKIALEEHLSIVTNELEIGVLRDINEIIKHLFTLKKSIPDVTNDVIEKLEFRTNNMLDAVDKLNGAIKNIVLQSDKYAKESIKSAVEAAKLDIRLAATKSASDSVSEAVGTEVEKTVVSITKAASALVEATNSAKGSIAEAAQEVAWGWRKGLGVVVGGGLCTGLTLITWLYFTGVINPSIEADKQTMKNGHMIESVWSKLSQSEQERITNLAKTTK